MSSVLLFVGSYVWQKVGSSNEQASGASPRTDCGSKLVSLKSRLPIDASYLKAVVGDQCYSSLRPA